MEVYCTKCNRPLHWYERIRINTLEPIYEEKKSGVSGTRSKTIDGFNLCKPCYKQYVEFTANFFN